MVKTADFIYNMLLPAGKRKFWPLPDPNGEAQELWIFDVMVEAAHIHQHADSGNDDPRNGLALTPDAHWLFDRGLWTAEPCGGEFVVLVAMDHFKDASPDGRSLCDRHGKPLFFLGDSGLGPIRGIWPGIGGIGLWGRWGMNLVCGLLMTTILGLKIGL
jgi:hypothetical protein